MGAVLQSLGRTVVAGVVLLLVMVGLVAALCAAVVAASHILTWLGF